MFTFEGSPDLIHFEPMTLLWLQPSKGKLDNPVATLASSDRITDAELLQICSGSSPTVKSLQQKVATQNAVRADVSQLPRARFLHRILFTKIDIH